ncbi:MAG: hypothetical protein ABI083_02425 [Lapillicoccus sp.]
MVLLLVGEHTEQLIGYLSRGELDEPGAAVSGLGERTATPRRSKSSIVRTMPDFSLPNTSMS